MRHHATVTYRPPDPHRSHDPSRSLITLVVLAVAALPARRRALAGAAGERPLDDRLDARPSGSFTVRRVTANRAGRDVISAVATSPSGETCRARASIA
jgi:hypothetical protein